MSTIFTDGLRVGTAGYPGDSRLAPASQEVGAPVPPLYRYSVVPAALLTNNIAALQIVSGAPASFTISGATGTTTTTINGTSYVDLGVARSLRISGGSSAVVVSVSIYGLDDYFQPMSQTLSGPSGAAFTSTTKAFRYVASGTASGNSTGGLAIGTGDRMGLPYRADFFSDLKVNFNGDLVTSSAGFTAAVTTTASATTGDVRGTYELQSASDGTKRFAVQGYIIDPNTITGVYGVSQA